MVVRSNSSPEIPCPRKYTITLKLRSLRKAATFCCASVDSHRFACGHQRPNLNGSPQKPAPLSCSDRVFHWTCSWLWRSFFLCLSKCCNLKCALPRLALLHWFWSSNSVPHTCLEWTSPSELSLSPAATISNLVKSTTNYWTTLQWLPYSDQ